MAEIIRAQQISRVFQAGGQKVQALSGVSFAAEEGSLTVLRGRSGSGKTTLLNILGTLDLPTTGEVFLSGEPITGLPEHRRAELRRTRMGFVFQSVALISAMTAYENVELSLKISEKRIPNRRSRIAECLRLVGLEKRMDHFPWQLSGGEQQRVGIARAIVHQPDILFADEPTAELDTARSIEVMGLFQQLCRESGITVIMTTHNTEVMEAADHVITLYDGKIEQTGG